MNNCTRLMQERARLYLGLPPLHLGDPLLLLLLELLQRVSRDHINKLKCPQSSAVRTAGYLLGDNTTGNQL